VSTVSAGWGDEELVVALRRAVRAREAVPADFVAAAKDAFAWHNIDAELAQLTYDSTRDAELAQAVRTEAASIRALTFTSAHLTIELEVTPDGLIGQIVPAEPAVIRVQPKAGAEAAVAADHVGLFSIRPIPSGSFRLQCHTDSGIEALTGWIEM
jgi:hypothetical protein